MGQTVSLDRNSLAKKLKITENQESRQLPLLYGKLWAIRSLFWNGCGQETGQEDDGERIVAKYFLDSKMSSFFELFLGFLINFYQVYCNYIKYINI
jgi:hypothetical protein